MDEEIDKILNRLFSVDDVKVVKEMLNIVNKDMFKAKQNRRIQELDNVLEGALR